MATTGAGPSRPDGAAGFSRLDQAVTEVVGVDLDPMDEHRLAERIGHLHRSQRRLAAERARVATELERRRTTVLPDPGPRDRERQRVRRDLAERTNSSPSAAKLDAQAGFAATRYRETGRAFAAGRIDAEHVRLIGETLDAIECDDARAAAEGELLEVALRANPTVLGRSARALLARQAPLAAEAAELRRQRDRRVTAYDTADGGFRFSGLLYGAAAETARVAMNAFRRPDARGELRTPAQRGADAFEQLCAQALRSGEAGEKHGVRPNVLVTVTTEQLELGDHGIGRFGSGQPVSLGHLRHLLRDSSWSRVVLAPDGTPIEASEAVRTVPIGLWRSLLARDGGCTWPGCDAPADWCDVAHGARPFADGGRLSPENATLLCRRHHRTFDDGDYRIDIDGDRVSFSRLGAGGCWVTVASEEESEGRTGRTPASQRREASGANDGLAMHRVTEPVRSPSAAPLAVRTTAAARPRRHQRGPAPVAVIAGDHRQAERPRTRRASDAPAVRTARNTATSQVMKTGPASTAGLPHGGADP